MASRSTDRTGRTLLTLTILAVVLGGLAGVLVGYYAQELLIDAGAIGGSTCDDARSLAACAAPRPSNLIVTMSGVLGMLGGFAGALFLRRRRSSGPGVRGADSRRRHRAATH